MIKKYLFPKSFFTCLLLTFQCNASAIDKNLLHAENIYKSFCSNIVSNNYKDINKNWSAIKKTKNLHIYKDKEETLRINILYRSNKIQKLIFTLYNNANKPTIELRSSHNCLLQNIRRIVYDKNSIAYEIQSLNVENYSVEERQLLNPNKPKLTSTNNKNIIALIDTGINYTLSQFHKNIAIKNGTILGFDYWDNDDKPFDSDPRQNPFYPRHHGSTVFSVLAKEAPKSLIAPYRFPALDMCRFKEVIEHIANNSIRLVNLSMGSNNLKDWECFEKTARKYNNIIFVVSAGNNGFDIDRRPIYPAALKLKNIITVTSSDQNGRIGRGSNIGKSSVDFIVPAERMEVIDHRGVKSYTGGTSYAVPRLVALISRFIDKNPKANNDKIFEFLKRRSIQKGIKKTKFGWIPGPLDDYLIN